MANMLAFIETYGGLSFAECDVTDVDELILAQLTYTDFADVVPPPGTGKALALGEAIAQVLERRGDSMPPGDPHRALLDALAAVPRYRQARITGYINHVETATENQFSAITVELGDGRRHIAYRGTDDTLVAWKDNCNMLFTCPIASQISADNYLYHTARESALPLRLTGHSKGGNLAMYAAAVAAADTRARLEGVWCFDAPGLARETMKTDGYHEIAAKIHAFIPQGSIVGMFFSPPKHVQMIFADARGISQHSLFTWQVSGQGFVRARRQTVSSRRAGKTFESVLRTLSPETQRAFVDTIHGIIRETQEETVTSLLQNWRRHLLTVVHALADTDRASRALILHVIGTFFRAAVRMFPAWEKEKTDTTKGESV